MDVQTIEQRLEELYVLRVKVPALEEQLARLESGATGSRVEIKEGPGAAPIHADRIAEAVAHIERIQGYIDEFKPQYEFLRTWATGALRELPLDMRHPMERHYLDGKTWPVVAEEIPYSLRHTYAIRAKAIRQISKQ